MTDRAPAQAQVEQSYDELPYESFPFHQSHPSHLFTIAKLYGLAPTPIEKCRVLEIGCASGGNIIPLALQYPDCQVVGIDISHVEIEAGVKTITYLKLNNIEIRHESIFDFAASQGKFDYIICHGVFSWVDSTIKDKIMQVCHDHLSDNGIAYISYNTYPGWNMVNSLRDLMLWQTRDMEDPAVKVKKARAALQFITDGLKEDHNPYAEFLNHEVKSLANQFDSYILHEHLSIFNDPMYFHQFISLANKHHLNYLSDAFLANIYVDILPAHFASKLNTLEDYVEVEQYIDFIRNQRFRCSLLCKAHHKINRNPKTKKIDPFYLQLEAETDHRDLKVEDIGKIGEINFYNALSNLKVRQPISQHAMLILMQNRHRFMHYDDLCEQLMEKSSFKTLDEVKTQLKNDLNLNLSAFAGLIKINAYPGNYTLKLSAKPVACPLARYQAHRDSYATNRLHHIISLEPVAKCIMPFLDGQHDLAALCQLVHQQMDKDTLNLLDENKQPLQDEKIIQQKILTLCHQALETIRTQALLIA